MRFLIVSDIHSNWHALEAVLDHAKGGYDRVLCCGDLVGYGADPNRVVEWARDSVSAIVRGNHDKVCFLPAELAWFNPAAQVATRWTIDTLTPENLKYLCGLPRGPLEVEKFQLAHGSPVDEDEYVISKSNAGALFEYLDHQVTFFGHTHVQGGFLLARGGTNVLPPVPENETHRVLELGPNAWYLVNPGSVGQPRDQDPRAAYLIYDSDRRIVEYHRVVYDVAGAQEKILAAGLPTLLAHRLSLGR